MLAPGSLVVSRLLPCAPVALSSSRCIHKYPPHEYHTRFSPEDGRKVPNQDVLDRFKRLNNGMWIHAVPGSRTRVNWMNLEELKNHRQIRLCSRIESEILDRLMSKYWTRPRYYIDDPYEPYHRVHGVPRTDPLYPRVDDRGRLLRERRKIMLDDTTADQHFYDR